MQDFKSLEEVYHHVQETCVVDLIKHALNLGEQHTEPLIEPEKGLYLPGNFEPTFSEGDTYYARRDLQFNREVKTFSDHRLGGKSNVKDYVDLSRTSPIVDFNTFVKNPDDILDKNFNTVMTAAELRKIARYFVKKPTIPAIAVRMAVGIVQSTVSMMCRHSASGYARYRPERLIKPEYFSIYDSKEVSYMDEYVQAFDDLLITVQDFIGDDHWNFYSYSIRGGSLIIRKGIDWRIQEYYRMKFESEDKSQQEG